MSVLAFIHSELVNHNLHKDHFVHKIGPDSFEVKKHEEIYGTKLLGNNSFLFLIEESSKISANNNRTIQLIFRKTIKMYYPNHFLNETGKTKNGYWTKLIPIGEKATLIWNILKDVNPEYYALFRNDMGTAYKLHLKLPRLKGIYLYLELEEGVISLRYKGEEKIFTNSIDWCLFVETIQKESDEITNFVYAIVKEVEKIDPTCCLLEMNNHMQAIQFYGKKITFEIEKRQDKYYFNYQGKEVIEDNFDLFKSSVFSYFKNTSKTNIVSASKGLSFYNKFLIETLGSISYVRSFSHQQLDNETLYYLFENGYDKNSIIFYGKSECEEMIKPYLHDKMHSIAKVFSCNSLLFILYSDGTGFYCLDVFQQRLN